MDSQILDFSALPEICTIPNGDGTYTQERDPVYQLQSDGYYGDCLFEEGEIITTRMVPNESFVPMNRAAGERIMRWVESLPEKGGENLQMQDLEEAARFIRNDPDYAKLKPEDVARQSFKLAVQMKAKREGRQMYIPPVQGDVHRTSRSAAPPMPNAKFTDPSRRGPGLSDQRVLHAPQRAAGPVARVRPGPAPIPAST